MFSRCSSAAMTRVLLIVAVFIGLHTMAAAAQDAASERALNEIIDEYERLIRLEDPISAGQDGDREALRRLPDPRRTTELSMARRFEALGERLSRIEARTLSAQSALNHALLTRSIAEAVEEAQFDFGRIAFENDSGFHTLGDYLARTTTIARSDDADAWLARLEATPAYYRRNIENLRRGVQTGYTQPRIVVERVLEVARRQALAPPQESPLLLPLVRMPSNIPPQAQGRYRDSALAVVREHILPLQREF